MADVTQILSQIEKGDPAGVVLAKENPGQTFQSTALVHEAYLKLVDSDPVQQWDLRGHFFAAAAEAMRQILVGNAHRKNTIKRGGNYHRVELSDVIRKFRSALQEIRPYEKPLRSSNCW